MSFYDIWILICIFQFYKIGIFLYIVDKITIANANENRYHSHYILFR